HSCMLVVIDSPSDPIPASTKAIFDIAQLVTTEKRAGLKNLHVVDLLADDLRPIRIFLYPSRLLRPPYWLRAPMVKTPEIALGMLLSQSLSKKLQNKLPEGVKVTRLTAKDLDKIKRYWLERELRSDDSWDRFVKTFDVTREYTVVAPKGVDIPVSIADDAHE